MMRVVPGLADLFNYSYTLGSSYKSNQNNLPAVAVVNSKKIKHHTTNNTMSD